VTFVGPEVDDATAKQRWKANSDVRAEFHQSVFHQCSAVPSADVVVLFNPGIYQHPSLWAPTVDALRLQGAPMLLTAFSLDDAGKERAHSPWLPDYAANPWASLQSKTYAGYGRVVVNELYALINCKE